MADQLSTENYIARTMQGQKRAFLARGPEIAAIHEEMVARYLELISA